MKAWIESIIEQLKKYGEILESEYQYDINGGTATETVEKNHDGEIYYHGNSYDDEGQYFWGGKLAENVDSLLAMENIEIENGMNEIYFYTFEKVE